MRPQLRLTGYGSTPITPSLRYDGAMVGRAGVEPTRWPLAWRPASQSFVPYRKGYSLLGTNHIGSMAVRYGLASIEGFVIGVVLESSFLLVAELGSLIQFGYQFLPFTSPHASFTNQAMAYTTTKFAVPIAATTAPAVKALRRSSVVKVLITLASFALRRCHRQVVATWAPLVVPTGTIHHYHGSLVYARLVIEPR